MRLLASEEGLWSTELWSSS